MKKRLLLFSAWLLGTCAAVAAGVRTEGASLGEWSQDVAACQALAKETGKPVLMNFTGSDWCGWCKLMDGSVFSKAEWTAWATQNVVCAWVDFPREKTLVPEAFRARNEALAQEYGVQGFPTYLLTDAEGKVLWRGGAASEPTPKWFIGELQTGLVLTLTPEALSKLDLPAEMRERFLKAKSAWEAKNTEFEALKAKFTALEEKAARELEPYLQAAQKAKDDGAAEAEMKAAFEAAQKKAAELREALLKEAAPLEAPFRKLLKEVEACKAQLGEFAHEIYN